MVPATLTFMPQPLATLKLSCSQGSSSPQESESARRPASGGSRSLDDKSESEACGISGRRRLVSGFGYSDPEVLNPYYADEESSAVLKCGYTSDRRPLEEVHQRLTRRSLILDRKETRSQYGSNLSTDVTLSTGVSLGHIPLISSTRSREGSVSLNRMCRDRITNGRVSLVGASQQMGETLYLKDNILHKSQAKSSVGSMSTWTTSEVNSPLQSSSGLTAALPMHLDTIMQDIPPAESVSSLGGIIIKLKYLSVNQQLTITVIGAVHLPARFHTPAGRLYVKVLLGKRTRYTTPDVEGTQHPAFYCAFVHALPPDSLASTSIRFSVCQLDPRSRRVVVGYATIHAAELWPTLTTSSPTLDQHMSASQEELPQQQLLLPLRDSAPQHQVKCDGQVTFGLTWSAASGRVTVCSVTLQDVGVTPGIDIGNALVYVKASAYRGQQLVCWRRSQPVQLNRQRTYLVHALHLALHKHCSLQSHDAAPGLQEMMREGDESRKQSVKDVDRKPSVKDVDRKQSVKDVDRKQSVKDVDRKPSVKDVDRKQPVKDVDRKQSVKDVDRKQSVKDVDRKQPVKDAEHKASVGDGRKPEVVQHENIIAEFDVQRKIKIADRGKHASNKENLEKIDYKNEYNLSAEVDDAKEIKSVNLTIHSAGLTARVQPSESSMTPKEQVEKYCESRSAKNALRPIAGSSAEDDPLTLLGDEDTEVIVQGGQKPGVGDQEQPFGIHDQEQFSSGRGEEHEIDKQEQQSGKHDQEHMYEEHDEQEQRGDDMPEQHHLAEEVEETAAVTPEEEQETPSLEDEDDIMLVLSVRLKLLTSNGRCILGAVQLGAHAPTPQGRSHWARAGAGMEVPIAGTHVLTHL